MKLLAIDSSTEACSVALLDGDELLEQYLLAPREHTQRLLPMVDAVLAETGTKLSQLDAIAFGRGPGSFTGLRICLGVVQGLAFGAELPVVPVSSLAALAQTAIDQQAVISGESILSTLDARMNEIYWGVFSIENGLAVALADEQLSAPEQLRLTELLSTTKSIVGVGSGWQYGERIACATEVSRIEAGLLPRAAAVARLAQRDFELGLSCSADQALPTYLRDQVAWKKQ